jgi:Polyketide cyclase / dehydrase and lipid transport
MHIQRRVAIQAPPQQVWEVVTDLRRAQEWAVGFTDYPFISPDWPKTGALATWRYHAGPFRVRFQLHVTESLPAKSLHIANRSIFGRGLEVYSFTFSAGVTTVWYDASDEPNLLGQILAPIFEKRLIKQVDATIARLKEYCERHARQRAR